MSGIYIVVGQMGKGKTVFSTSYAVAFSQNFPKSKIFSNYKINLPNAVFTPFMFLPFADLENSLIICDDIYALNNVMGFISVIVNASRKKNITVIITAQYYTMIPKLLRTLSDEVFIELKKKSDGTTDFYVCIQKEIGKDKYKRVFQKITNVFEKIKGVFDTNEIVEFNNPNRIKEEIMKFSHNFDELESNICLFSGSKTEQKSLMKELNKVANYVNPLTEM